MSQSHNVYWNCFRPCRVIPTCSEEEEGRVGTENGGVSELKHSLKYSLLRRHSLFDTLM